MSQERDFFQNVQEFDWSEMEEFERQVRLELSQSELSAVEVVSQAEKEPVKLEETPPSSRSYDPNLNIRGRKLNFGVSAASTSGSGDGNAIETAGDGGDPVILNGWKSCVDGKVAVSIEVRRFITGEFLKETMDAGFDEVMNCFTDAVPEDAKKYILQRRAAILPIKCNLCSRWRPPMYRCRYCGIPLLGTNVESHEEACCQMFLAKAEASKK